MLKNFFGPERSANDIQDHPNLLDWPPPPILVCSPIGKHIVKPADKIMSANGVHSFDRCNNSNEERNNDS